MSGTASKYFARVPLSPDFPDYVHGPGTNTVAVIDKKGWQIQSFLKTLNLKIQSIVAASAHALMAENWSSIVFALHYLCSHPPLRLELANRTAYPHANILTHHNLTAQLNAHFWTLLHSGGNPQALLAFA